MCLPFEFTATNGAITINAVKISKPNWMPTIWTFDSPRRQFAFPFIGGKMKVPIIKICNVQQNAEYHHRYHYYLRNE